MKKIILISMLLIFSNSYCLTQKEILKVYEKDANAQIEASNQRQQDMEQLQLALNWMVMNEITSQRETIKRLNDLLSQQINKQKKIKKNKEK